MTKEKFNESILEIIKDESEKSNVRQFTCINGFGYSQFERNIADKVIEKIKILLHDAVDYSSQNGFVDHQDLDKWIEENL
jgi:hypothetical protein